jgi:hypothetical protein
VRCNAECGGRRECARRRRGSRVRGAVSMYFDRVHTAHPAMSASGMINPTVAPMMSSTNIAIMIIRFNRPNAASPFDPYAHGLYSAHSAPRLRGSYLLRSH